MNREQRRNMEKQSGGELKYLNTPCTINEAVQIARGVAEDVVTDYQNHSGPLQISMSLQIELIKNVLIDAGLITEESFKEKYIEQVENFNRMQKEAMNLSEESEDTDTPHLEVISNEIEVKKL